MRSDWEAHKTSATRECIRHPHIPCECLFFQYRHGYKRSWYFCEIDVNQPPKRKKIPNLDRMAARWVMHWAWSKQGPTFLADTYTCVGVLDYHRFNWRFWCSHQDSKCWHISNMSNDHVEIHWRNSFKRLMFSSVMFSSLCGLCKRDCERLCWSTDAGDGHVDVNGGGRTRWHDPVNSTTLTCWTNLHFRSSTFCKRIHDRGAVGCCPFSGIFAGTRMYTVCYFCLDFFTHLPLDNMAATLQTIFSDAFSWMKNFVCWLKFHWSLFLRIQLIIIQHWFR